MGEAAAAPVVSDAKTPEGQATWAQFCAAGRRAQLARETWVASLSESEREQLDETDKARLEEFAQRTADKRARYRPGGSVSFEAEWQAATRAVFGIPNTAPFARTNVQVASGRESHSGQAGHQRRSPAASSSDGDSDSPSPDDPPPLALWRHAKFGLVNRLLAAFLDIEEAVG